MSKSNINNNNKYTAKIVPEKSVAKTNPINTSQQYHDVDNIAQNLGVEVPDEKELSLKEDLESRDENR